VVLTLLAWVVIACLTNKLTIEGKYLEDFILKPLKDITVGEALWCALIYSILFGK